MGLLESAFPGSRAVIAHAVCVRVFTVKYPTVYDTSECSPSSACPSQLTSLFAGELWLARRTVPNHWSRRAEIMFHPLRARVSVCVGTVGENRSRCVACVLC